MPTLLTTQSFAPSRYIEETSEWTIDYPPFFAWFERLLAHPAALLEPAMLHISKTSYESAKCILFQVKALFLYVASYQ